VNVRLQVEVVADAAAVARRGAAEIALAVRSAVEARGTCAIALSGGTTPWVMFAALDADLPWDRLDIWQVDERIAPLGSEDRGLTHLGESLPAPGRSRVHAMPVDGLDPLDDAGLQAAAATYATTLPQAFDLIHLGLGDDGHTASLVPGDPVLDVRDRLVAVTQPYRGWRRMTLTYPALDRARRILWIAVGDAKSAPLHMLRNRDAAIPASRISAANQLAIVDFEAAR
jgi:6-phosphogluconolactonase